MIDDPMTEALSRFLDVNVARHKLIAANLANIDTPGYRTRDLDFRAELARANLGSEWTDRRNFELCGLRTGSADGAGIAAASRWQ